MRAAFLFSCLILTSFSFPASQVAGQPPREGKQEKEVPDGFVLQKLVLGGEILKPTNWKYESREIGKTIATKMWEPIENKEYDFDTAVTIDIVTNLAEAKKVPSEYAATYLESLKKDAKVIETFEPQTKNGLIHSSVILDQKLKIGDSDKDYRIRYILVADDKNELLFVMTLGTLVEKWDSCLPTFKVMTKGFKLMDTTEQGNLKK